MAIRKKFKSRTVALKAYKAVATLKSFTPSGVDLGSLQAEYVTTKRTLKAAATKVANAQDHFDASKAAFNAASDKLKAASRAVLADA